MTYLELLRDAERKLDNDEITLGEYEKLIKPLRQEVIAPVDKPYLIDWYISSVDGSEPVWTEKHIDELLYDFYLIPKEVEE